MMLGILPVGQGLWEGLLDSWMEKKITGKVMIHSPETVLELFARQWGVHVWCPLKVLKALG